MSFEITMQDAASAEDVGGIRIRFGNETLTRLMRPGKGDESEYLHAPAGALAAWLIDHWWRLRYEPIPGQPTPIQKIAAAWRLAHDLRSIGSGYPWPAAILWSDGVQAFACAEPDPVGVTAPVRFLAEVPRAAVSAQEFEQGADSFLEAACAAAGIGESLHALKAERSDPEHAAWRRLEACLGFDPDGAPDEAMSDLRDFADKYGEPNIEEAAAAAPGPDAAQALRRHIACVLGAGSWACVFPAPDKPNAADATAQGAEQQATQLRQTLKITGPLTDGDLGELCGTSPQAFGASTKVNLRYGLRLQTEGAPEQRVIVKSGRPENRRFQFARALGDYLLGPQAAAALGPLADSNTARQKFQRAFAASLLCPIGELRAMLPAEPDEDDIEGAAQHFRVSPYLVASTLANHGIATPAQPPWPDYAASA